MFAYFFSQCKQVFFAPVFRYPSFIDAIRDLDDCLSMSFLFATFPKTKVTHEIFISLCRRLTGMFDLEIICRNVKKMHFPTCAPSKDSNQPAYPCSLYSLHEESFHSLLFKMHPVNILIRLANAQTELNLC